MDAPRRPQPSIAAAVAGLLVVAGLVGLALSDLGDLFTALAALLTVCAVAAELVGRAATHVRSPPRSSAGMLAVGFLGPAAGVLIPVAVVLSRSGSSSAIAGGRC